MKKTILGLVLSIPLLSYSAPPVHGHGRGDALQTAQQLARTLNSIEVESSQVAQKAMANGNYVRSQRFNELSYRAAQLEREFRQAVVRPLKNGEPHRRVANNLQGLNYEFQELNQAVSVIQQMPVTLENNVILVRQLLQELRRELAGGVVVPGRLFECRANDQGFEEHIFNPHLGYGRTQAEAQASALRACQAHHGRCHIVACVLK